MAENEVLAAADDHMESAPPYLTFQGATTRRFGAPALCALAFFQPEHWSILDRGIASRSTARLPV
jgi:hypothetical protein